MSTTTNRITDKNSDCSQTFFQLVGFESPINFHSHFRAQSSKITKEIPKK